MTEIEFREAVYHDIINLYEDQCLKIVKQTLNGELNSYEFNTYAAMIFGALLCDVYTSDHKRYLELVTPLVEEYCKNKTDQDASYKRTLMKIANISVVK